MKLDLTKYLGLFVSEASEHLATLSAELVRLEAAARTGEEVPPIVDELFRRAHSVKGMAASMELEGIAALAHSAEDLVDAVRRRGTAPEAGSVDVLLAAVDALSAMVARAAQGGSPEADAALVERLRAEAERTRGGAEAPRARRRVEIAVEVATACPVPSVRAFLVVKKLSRLGTVVSSTPPVQDLKAGRIPDRKVEVVLETAEPLAAVEATLAQISDLQAVSAREAAPAPAPAVAPAAPGAERVADGARTVRVRVELLDSFLDAVGELILSTARLREVGRGLPAPFRPALEDGVDRLASTVKDLHDKVMAVRMTPLGTVTDRLPRVGRDLARRVGKQVDVEVRGADIEIDRAVLDELADPLQHVLRNAIDHGVEAPHLRLLAGKPATGRVTVAARRERDRVLVEIADDGKGMDPDVLRAAAVARGALDAEAAGALSDREALLLACLPGVSTAEQVTEVSGRGVGMDAVKRAVEALGGAVDVESTPGLGTRWILRLPLTVAVQPVLLVRVAGEVLGLPIAKVHGAADVELAQLGTSQGAPVLPYEGKVVPVRDLAALLGFGGGAAPRSVVVAEAESGRVGLAVDALLGQYEAVLKPLARPLDLVAGLSAVTVLGNGRPVFILDVQRLLAA